MSQLSVELTKIESEISEKRSELESIKYKLKAAYDFKDYLLVEVTAAEKKITNLQLKFIEKTQEISKAINTVEWKVGRFEEEIKKQK